MARGERSNCFLAFEKNVQNLSMPNQSLESETSHRVQGLYRKGVGKEQSSGINQLLHALGHYTNENRKEIK